MNITTDYLASRARHAFGDPGLRRLPKPVLDEAGIEALDAEFLQKTGVPREKLFELDFNVADRLPPVRRLAREHGRLVPEGLGDARCLDEHYDLVVAVDVHSGGQVVWLDLCGNESTRFVNSNVRFLVGFLAETVLQIARRPADVALTAAIAETRAWMTSVDAPAIAGDGWWPIVLEQLELGTL